MNFISAISLIVCVIIVYYLMVKLYSVLFRITGVTKEKSYFQAVSLLTNAGYSTTESEIIVGDKTRRAIAKWAMLTGYFFSVVIVSLFINLFLSIDFTHFDSDLVALLVGFGFLFLFFIILYIPPIQRRLDKIIDEVTVRVFRHATKENFISVLDAYGDDAICKIFLYQVPSLLKGKRIIDSGIKAKYNINILMYERKGNAKYVSKDTIFSDRDTLLLFGQLDNIKEVFLLKEKNKIKSDLNENTLVCENTISIIENYDYQVLADINVVEVPESLKEKTLLESKIKDYFQINVMMVSRAGEIINITKDTIIKNGDKVIAFGPYQSIWTVFGQSRRK